MLIVRKAQIEAFRSAALDTFVASMANYLEQTYPERFTSTRGLSEADRPVCRLIRDGVDRAAKYKIINEGDVSRYIELMVKLGPDFDVAESMEWARRYLASAEIPGSAKMDIIMHEMAASEQKSKDGVSGH
jgi:hypothetical protein